MAMYNLSDVQNYITDGSLPISLNRRGQKSLWQYSKQFVIKVGQFLFQGTRKVILEDEEKDLIFRDCHSERHGGHMGVNKTLNKISERFYWRNMTKFVKDKISCCDKCQRFEKIKTVAPELKPINSESTWDILGMDLIGPFPETEKRHKYIVTITDLFSKCVEAVLIPQKTSEQVANVLMDLFFHFGPPNKVITDQGREFVNELNESLFSKFKVKHLITSAYHPQTNGQDERTNRTIKTALA